MGIVSVFMTQEEIIPLTLRKKAGFVIRDEGKGGKIQKNPPPKVIFLTRGIQLYRNLGCYSLAWTENCCEKMIKSLRPENQETSLRYAVTISEGSGPWARIAWMLETLK